MASTINATSTGSGGLITTGNSVNQLELQTGDTTRVVIDSSGNVTIQGQGDLRLADSDSSHYVALQAPGTVASNVTFTLPSADGTNGQLLQTNGSGTLSFTTVSAGMTLGTPIATTSGTTHQFTGLPSGIKMIVFNFKSVSMASANQMRIQIGDSGGFETSGYESRCAIIQSGTTGFSNSTNGYAISFSGTSSSFTASGSVMLVLENSTNNTWCASYNLCDSVNIAVVCGGGSKSLSATLDRIRIDADDAFDAGEINIAYF